MFPVNIIPDFETDAYEVSPKRTTRPLVSCGKHCKEFPASPYMGWVKHRVPDEHSGLPSNPEKSAVKQPHTHTQTHMTQEDDNMGLSRNVFPKREGHKSISYSPRELLSISSTHASTGTSVFKGFLLFVQQPHDSSKPRPPAASGAKRAPFALALEFKGNKCTYALVLKENTSGKTENHCTTGGQSGHVIPRSAK